jgi:hypothetical protein
LCDDLLKWQHHRDDAQSELTDAEIMTIAIVAAMHYGGNQALSRMMLEEGKYIKHKIRLKLHLVVTKEGLPVEFLLSPGGWNDTALLDQFDCDLPPGAKVIGDKAYNAYLIEDIMAECDLLLPLRRQNSHRPHPGWTTYLLSTYRKRVETAGSQIERLLPKHIHATTAEGFEFKTLLFVLASTIDRLDVDR